MKKLIYATLVAFICSAVPLVANAAPVQKSGLQFVKADKPDKASKHKKKKKKKKKEAKHAAHHGHKGRKAA